MGKMYEYVDLGLPSGTLWATCNVGAKHPWEYGGYYAWGETGEATDGSRCKWERVPIGELIEKGVIDGKVCLRGSCK